MAKRPEYQIIEVDLKNGIRNKSIVSKGLMFKCDAQRVADWKNRNDATFINYDNAHYWDICKNGRALQPSL